MDPNKRFYVYFMASKSRVLYVGMTGFLMQRVQQHKAGECEGFTKKYNVNRLVYYETFPTWEDLSEPWGKPVQLLTADSSLRSE
jgi:predicted GIY-YIG superfamily endonuclease